MVPRRRWWLLGILGIVLLLAEPGPLERPLGPFAMVASAAQAPEAEAVQAAVAAARASGSNVAVSIEQPRAGQTLDRLVEIDGWAADLQPGGPGIDAANVQIWLDGRDGAPLGFAAYPWRRDALAALLGDEQFTQTGFRLGLDPCAVSPGAHRLVAYAWRRETSDFGTADVDVVVPPCARPPGVVLWSDPLDGAQQQWWPVGATEACTARYQDGGYQVRKLAPNRVEYCASPPWERVVHGDFALEVDIRVLDPSPAADAAIGLRMNISEVSARYSDGYIVRVNPALGIVGLLYGYYTTQGPVYLRLAEAHPDSMRAGAATNRVRIQATGPQLSVAVNGQPALQAQDDRVQRGSVALGAGAPLGQDSAEVNFRDLAVTAP
jgi:hypothetical protein